MLTIPETVQHLVGSRTKRIATLFDLTLKDATTKRFTDHDGSLSYGGNTYTPVGIADISARRFESGQRPSSVDVRGILASGDITTEDLHAGLYDEARIDETLVDWRYPWRGALASWSYWIDQVRYDGESWTAELSGSARFMRRRVGESLTRNCQRKLGDSLCQVTLASFTVTGSVLGTEDGDKRLVIFAAGFGSFSDGYFADGQITWTSGANDGLSENVKAYRDADKRVELQNQMPHPIGVGDAFSLIAGCDKTAATCDTKFSNIDNFGGWLYVPGTDRALQTPRRRA